MSVVEIRMGGMTHFPARRDAFRIRPKNPSANPTARLVAPAANISWLCALIRPNNFGQMRRSIVWHFQGTARTMGRRSYQAIEGEIRWRITLRY